MSIKTSDILLHVAEVLMSKANGDLSPMRQSFNDIAEGKKFSKGELLLLLRHASKIGQRSLDDNHTSLWHNFKDGLGKKLSSGTASGIYPRETVLDVIIFSDWVSKNYSMIMGFELSKTVPKLLCRAAEVSDFKTFVSYLDLSVIPSLKNAYCEEYGVDQQVLKHQIKIREKELIDSNIDGIEIIKPVPRSKWSKAKGPDAAP